MKNYVQCPCCKLPIKIALQERREKTPLINITCENHSCTAYGYTVTLTDESEFPDYPARLQEKINEDAEWLRNCRGE